MVEKILQFDSGRNWKAKFGFVLLATEQTIEQDLFYMAPHGIGLHFARVPSQDHVTVESFSGALRHISESSRLLLPGTTLDAICYTCNIGTALLGEENVLIALTNNSTSKFQTTVLTGIVKALCAFKARNIGLLTPYTRELHHHAELFFVQKGFSIQSSVYLGISDNSQIDKVTPTSIFETAKMMNLGRCDALVICCGALRAIEKISALEGHLKKPVIASNQAMFWDCLRLSGNDENVDNYGSLFSITVNVHEKL